MTKPRIIGYADEWEGPVGGTLGGTDMSTARFVRTRPIYAPRPFRATPTHDGYRLNGWKLYCRNCKTATMSTVRLPHDLAVTHECLYDPAQVE